MEHRPRILIVEDDEGARRTLTFILERKGYDVVTATTAQEALERADGGARLPHGRFNVGLLDIRLPDGKGVDLVMPLRERHPGMELIMVTGYASMETAIRALNDGAIAYITKPLNMDEVLAEVRKILEKQRLTAEKQRAEEALRESEEKYRTILDTIEDGYYEVDLTGRFTFFNDALPELLGYPDEKLMGMDNRQYMDEENAREVYETFNTVYLTRQPAKAFDWEVIREDGRRRVVEASVSLMQDAAGEPVGFRGIVRDVTERKRAEEQMHQQERLAAVGRLAGGIAHDFNNFLSTIRLYGDMILRDEDLPPRLVSASETIIAESKRATDLVRQILDFSRRSSMEVQTVDLVSFLGEVCDILQTTLPESIRLTTETESEACLVDADPTRIQQVVMNLAINARDAMPEGGDLQIALSKMVVAADEDAPAVGMGSGEWACLAVSDTGTGMTEEVRTQIFEPFFTTKEPGQGTGLGLAQVYGIVKQHSGYIDVETELGSGTDFFVYLPIHAARRVTQKRENSSVPLGKGEAILLVEDHEDLRAAGRQILEDLGYSALAAAHGREALEVLKGVAVDLVVTDVVMPVMGGEALMQELSKAYPSLPVLAVTGYTVDEELSKLEEADFFDVLHKPLDTPVLAQAVRRALDARKGCSD